MSLALGAILSSSPIKIKFSRKLWSIQVFSTVTVCEETSIFFSSASLSYLNRCFWKTQTAYGSTEIRAGGEIGVIMAADPYIAVLESAPNLWDPSLFFWSLQPNVLSMERRAPCWNCAAEIVSYTRRTFIKISVARCPQLSSRNGTSCLLIVGWVRLNFGFSQPGETYISDGKCSPLVGEHSYLSNISCPKCEGLYMEPSFSGYKRGSPDEATQGKGYLNEKWWKGLEINLRAFAVWVLQWRKA